MKIYYFWIQSNSTKEWCEVSIAALCSQTARAAIVKNNPTFYVELFGVTE